MILKSTKRKVVATLILAILVPAGLAAVLYAQTTRPADRPSEISYRNDLSAGELAVMLGDYLWKYDISLPPGTRRVQVQLQLRDQSASPIDKVWGLACQGGVSPQRPAGQLLVAVVPLDGDLTNADKIRLTLSGFGVYASTTTNNPFKSLALGAPRGGNVYPDGAIALVGGFHAGKAVSSPVNSGADTVIALKISPESTP